MEERAVCRVIRNDGSQLVLEIRDRFWPYQKHIFVITSIRDGCH
jgi:hypothetical protein